MYQSKIKSKCGETKNKTKQNISCANRSNKLRITEKLIQTHTKSIRFALKLTICNTNGIKINHTQTQKVHLFWLNWWSKNDMIEMRIEAKQRCIKIIRQWWYIFKQTKQFSA